MHFVLLLFAGKRSTLCNTDQKTDGRHPSLLTQGCHRVKTFVSLRYSFGQPACEQPLHLQYMRSCTRSDCPNIMDRRNSLYYLPRYGFPHRTSGDIYAGEPLWSFSRSFSLPRCFPKQKLVMVTRWVRRFKTRLPSFRSRWTMFFCKDSREVSWDRTVSFGVQ